MGTRPFLICARSASRCGHAEKRNRLRAGAQKRQKQHEKAGACPCCFSPLSPLPGKLVVTQSKQVSWLMARRVCPPDRRLLGPCGPMAYRLPPAKYSNGCCAGFAPASLFTGPGPLRAARHFDCVFDFPFFIISFPSGTVKGAQGFDAGPFLCYNPPANRTGLHRRPDRRNGFQAVSRKPRRDRQTEGDHAR